MVAQNKSLFVIERRRRIKAIIIEQLGGKCCICGYNKYQGALELHHLDPDTKEFGLAIMVSKSLKAIAKEMKKCILCCSNCHKEVHAGITQIPVDVTRIDESFEFGTSHLKKNMGV